MTFVAVAGVVAAVGVPILLDITNPPDDAVLGTLNDSASGDVSNVTGWFAEASTANALADPPRKGHVPPSNPRVIETVNDGRDYARLTVSYALGETTRTEKIDVTRDGLFAPWRIDATPPVLEVDTGWPVPIAVAGEGTSSGAVAASPGTYRVEVDHELLTPEPKTAVVGLGGGTVELHPKVSEHANDVASDAINAAVDSCATIDELSVQSGCPFFETRPRVPAPQSASWTITDYPAIALTPDAGEFQVGTKATGLATLRLAYEGRKATTVECRFNVDGSLRVDGAEPKWSGNPVTNLEGCDEGDP